MTTIVDWHKVDHQDVAKALREARQKLTGSEGEVLLDFSEVQRIDAAGLLAFEELLTAAEQKSIKVALRGVNVSVYKVLKLARLSGRLTFVN